MGRLNPITISNEYDKKDEDENEYHFENGMSVPWNEGNNDEYDKMLNGNDNGYNHNKYYKQNEHINNDCNGSPIKYVETVRGNKRNELPGHDCAQCAKFYALNANLKRPNELCNHISRHRAKHKVPATPQSFWNIGFDTQ